MDLWSSIRVLIRRWYVTVPLLALSVVITIGVVGTSPAHYTSNASLLLLAPSTGENNPFQEFGGTQAAAAEVIVTSLNSSTSRRELERAGLVGDWNVALAGDPAPLVRVETTAPTAEEATASAQEIVATAKSRLSDLQSEAGSPTDQLLTLSVIDSPDNATAEYGSTVRAAGALFVVLFVASCAIVFAFEALAVARRRKGAESTDESESTDDDAVFDPVREQRIS